MASTFKKCSVAYITALQSSEEAPKAADKEVALHALQELGHISKAGIVDKQHITQLLHELLGYDGRRQAMAGRHFTAAAQLELLAVIFLRNIQQVAWVIKKLAFKIYYVTYVYKYM